MRTIFEAYLTEQADHYLLYLDDFHFSELFKSIGLQNIHKIRIIYRQVSGDKGITDEIIYHGIGEIPDMLDILRIPFSRDCFEKIIINDTIEISFCWWKDIFILADLETITKCIEGQKLVATVGQQEVLDRLIDSKNCYFKLKNETLIVSQEMNLGDFRLLLQGSYLEKESELLCDLTDEERAELDASEEELHTKLNLSEEERCRLKSGLDLFHYEPIHYESTEVLGKEEIKMVACRNIREKLMAYTENDSFETGESWTLSKSLDESAKNEMVKIKEFYVKFKFPETAEGQKDESDFFDELSELYQSPNEEEAQQIISKFKKYYQITFKKKVTTMFYTTDQHFLCKCPNCHYPTSMPKSEIGAVPNDYLQCTRCKCIFSVSDLKEFHSLAQFYYSPEDLEDCRGEIPSMQVIEKLKRSQKE